MDAETRADIEALKTASVTELKRRYRELFGEPSRSSNRAHLWRRLAWRLQARREGGLSERARRRARELADEADLRLRAPGSFWKELEQDSGDSGAARRDPRVPVAGTVLTRSYRGATVIVTVLTAGFEYEGRMYRSLSAIANLASGTSWNGYAFFGLNGGRRG